MGKAVLISIRPEWCYLIAIGQKLLELRKRIPNIPAPYHAYIYCTKGKTLYRSQYDGEIRLYHKAASHAFDHHAVFNGKVWSEFICDWTDQYYTCDWWLAASAACVSMDDIGKYLDGKANINGMHISNLTIYDKPKELSEFWSWQPSVEWKDGYPMPTHLIKRPPQSFMYVEELADG